MKGEFYKMDFRAWNVGTVDLTLEQEAAYLRLCHAMYDVGGPIPNSTRMLMGLFRCGNVKAMSLLSALLKAGKIAVTSDDRLTNYRVTEELASREKVSAARRISGEKGGSASRVGAEWVPSEPRVNPECLPSDRRVNSTKSLRNNETDEAIAPAPLSRGEEIREEKKPPKAPKGADAGFEKFRAAYPKKHTSFPTEQARKRYVEAIKGGATPEQIEAGAKAFAAEQTRVGNVGTRYVKSADSWLHQRRWLDYSQAGAAPPDASTPAANPEQDRRHRLRLAIDHFRDEWRQGTDEQYRPGTAGCTTSPDIVEEARLAVSTERILTERLLTSNAA